MSGKRTISPVAVFTGLGGVLVLTLVLPLAWLMATTGNDWGGVVGDTRTLSAVRVSLITSSLATLAMAVLGVPLGYLLARGLVPFRRLIAGLVMLPMVVPGLAGGIMLLQVYGPNGPVGGRLRDLGIVFNGSSAGIVLAQLYVACPFVVMSSMMAFVGVDPQLEAAAASLGDPSWRTFRKVSIPVAWPGIVAGLALAWMRALGEFGAVMILAYNPRTLPVHLWVRFESRGLSGALPVATLLIVVAGATLAIWTAFSRLTGDENSRFVPAVFGGRR